MSLFDATAVTPPTPCSRCGVRVQVASLFCPECGQSMVRPLPAPAPVVNAPEPSEVAPQPEEPEPSVRTTGWLRRSLSLGKKTEVSPPSPRTSPDQETQVMSLFDIAEAQTVAEAKPARRANAGVRFVLKFVDGSSVTVDDRPGIIGVKPVQDSDQVFRICVEDDTDTVAPEHLEFGVENGVFWVQDLKTVTGTMVAEPEAPVIQCIPYEKYFLVRGSRVNIGEVTFTLH